MDLEAGVSQVLEPTQAWFTGVFSERLSDLLGRHVRLSDGGAAQFAPGLEVEARLGRWVGGAASGATSAASAAAASVRQGGARFEPGVTLAYFTATRQRLLHTSAQPPPAERTFIDVIFEHSRRRVEVELLPSGPAVLAVITKARAPWLRWARAGLAVWCARSAPPSSPLAPPSLSPPPVADRRAPDEGGRPGLPLSCE
jgi:hypothetical protein